MLTRLKVDGFKNLDDVDVRFGPFTCVAGPNGAGKSNLFDAIAFLSALADRTLAEAAAQVRGCEGRMGDVLGLFFATGSTRAPEIRLLVEMIVPKAGMDDLGSTAKASMTFLRYELRLRHRDPAGPLGPLEVVFERMSYVSASKAKESLPFEHAETWRESVVEGRRTVPYIDTELDEEGRAVVLIRADSEGGQGGGRPRKLLAANMPRTVLSTANNAVEMRTLVLARREMQSWTQFQLEPSALRAPDPFHSPRRVGANGAHLPGTLFGLAEAAKRDRAGGDADAYQAVANRLAGLLENVRTLNVVEDKTREQYSIVMQDLDGTQHVASSLSDGTLRFLALAILEASPSGPAVLCLEEPENGIHPDRIPVMLQLLRDIAVDVGNPAGPDNPMRQVLINTHSPLVVQCVPEDSLVLAEVPKHAQSGGRKLRLRGIPGTWRVPPGGEASLLPLIGYLRPWHDTPSTSSVPGEKRVIDRADIHQLRLFSGPDAEAK